MENTQSITYKNSVYQWYKKFFKFSGLLLTFIVVIVTLLFFLLSKSLLFIAVSLIIWPLILPTIILKFRILLGKYIPNEIYYGQKKIILKFRNATQIIDVRSIDTIKIYKLSPNREKVEIFITNKPIIEIIVDPKIGKCLQNLILHQKR